MPPQAACRIVVLGPPLAVDYGLQKGHGSKYETVQTERSNGEDLRFAFRIGVKAGGKGAPDFGGIAHVHDALHAVRPTETDEHIERARGVFSSVTLQSETQAPAYVVTFSPV